MSWKTMTGTLLLMAAASEARAGDILEERALDGFDAVTLRGSGDLNVIRGDRFLVRIQADERIMEYVVTEVSGDRLLLYVDPPWHWGWGRGTVRYEVTMPELTAVTTAGSGNVHLANFDSESLRIRIAGSGDLAMHNMIIDQLDCDISGSGTIRADGEVHKATVKIAGSGDLLAENLLAQALNIRIRGSGDARVRTVERLDVDIAGSGSVLYSGAPRVNQRIRGSGRVRSRDLDSDSIAI